MHEGMDYAEPPEELSTRMRIHVTRCLAGRFYAFDLRVPHPSDGPLWHRIALQSGGAAPMHNVLWRRPARARERNVPVSRTLPILIRSVTAATLLAAWPPAAIAAPTTALAAPVAGPMTTEPARQTASQPASAPGFRGIWYRHEPRPG